MKAVCVSSNKSTAGKRRGCRRRWRLESQREELLFVWRQVVLSWTVSCYLSPAPDEQIIQSILISSWPNTHLILQLVYCTTRRWCIPFCHLLRKNKKKTWIEQNLWCRVLTGEVEQFIITTTNGLHQHQHWKLALVVWPWQLVLLKSSTFYICT